MNEKRFQKRSVFLVVYLLFALLPIYWMVNMSFKTNNEILAGFTLFPEHFTWANYETILTDPAWYSGYINSLIYVGEGGGGAVGDDRFHQLLEREWEMAESPTYDNVKNWDGIHSYETIYTRVNDLIEGEFTEMGSIPQLEAPKNRDTTVVDLPTMPLPMMLNAITKMRQQLDGEWIETEAPKEKEGKNDNLS